MNSISERHIRGIHDAGGQFVVLRANSKTPACKGHMDLWPTVDECLDHQKRGGRLGVRPASLGCVVMDCDEGDGPQVAADWAGEALACVTPSSSGAAHRGHVWICCDRAAEVGNWDFRVEDATGLEETSGELRTSVHVALTPDSAEAVAMSLPLMELSPVKRSADFQSVRISTAQEVDPDFDPEEGREVCPEEDGGAWLEERLQQPDDRSQTLFALAGHLKSRGVSFQSALEYLEPHTSAWTKVSTGAADGAYAGAGLGSVLNKVAVLAER